MSLYGQKLITSKIATRVPHISTLREHHSSPLKYMLHLISSRSSPFRGSIRSQDFSSEPTSSSKGSLMISADSYAALSFKFITCNTPKRGQLWMVAYLHTCNPNKQAPVITIVTRNRHVKIM